MRSIVLAFGALLMTCAVASAQAPRPAGDMMGRHTMEGHVTKVDAKKGWIDVKTSEGSMKLHFPPEALQGVKTGDSVSIELGIKDHGPVKGK